MTTAIVVTVEMADSLYSEMMWLGTHGWTSVKDCLCDHHHLHVMSSKCFSVLSCDGLPSLVLEAWYTQLRPREAQEAASECTGCAGHGRSSPSPPPPPSIFLFRSSSLLLLLLPPPSSFSLLLPPLSSSFLFLPLLLLSSGVSSLQIPPHFFFFFFNFFLR